MNENQRKIRIIFSKKNLFFLIIMLAVASLAFLFFGKEINSLPLLIFGSVAFTYYRIVMARDYFITAEADCDPTIEKCFIYVCDPTAEEECTGNPEEDTWYYKMTIFSEAMLREGVMIS